MDNQLCFIDRRYQIPNSLPWPQQLLTLAVGLEMLIGPSSGFPLKIYAGICLAPLAENT
jgi:hypothetical protein